jgi:uncharacterized protein (DUF1499 family)
LPQSSLGFSPNSHPQQSSLRNNKHISQLSASVSSDNNNLSRKDWLNSVLSSALLIPAISNAEDEVTEQAAASIPSIEKCDVGSNIPCVSTANVRQLDLYSPPWTFTCSSEEAMTKLKRAIVTDLSNEVVQQIDSSYLKVKGKRGISSIDELEFVINDSDQVVFFRALATTKGNDFGFNKKRLEEIRKRAKVFGRMGEGVGSSDSATNSQQGYGPLGQLKAFYGLQSGAGYEDVLQE